MSAEANKQRICLFGGTFDPIHRGHIHIAEIAQEKFHLDRVIFLPCKQSPHKTGQKHAEAEHRLKMCQLATQDYSWAEVSDYDLTAPSPSYSWRTAEVMKARFPNAKLYWLMGKDQWDVIQHWNKSSYLASLVEFIIFQRGSPAKSVDGYTAHMIDGDHPRIIHLNTPGITYKQRSVSQVMAQS